MTHSQRSIFRDHALQQYARRREKDVLPHLVVPVAFTAFWLLQGLLLIAFIFLLPGLAVLMGGR